MSSAEGTANGGGNASQGAPADVAVLPPRYHGLVVAGIMLATILPLLDTTIANVAIPHMQSALSATPESVMWVLTSYIIAHAVAMPLTGWLSDRIGSRQLFLYSTAGFILTSMLCGIAQNIEQMVIYRTLQGIAGAFIMPLSQSLLLDVSRPSRHPQMMTIWGFGAVLGPIMGPLTGGWITENWDWRWAFLVNVPLGLISLVTLYFTLPGHPKKRRPFDLTGFVLVGLCMASLQLMLDRGQQVDWFDALESWLYLFIALSTLWMAIIHLVTSSNPLFDRALFRDVNFLIAFIFMMVVGMVIYATAALLAPMLQILFHFTAYDTGLVIAPRGIGAMIAMQLANRMIARRIDPRFPIALGFSFAIWSLYAMSGWTLEVSLPQFLWTGVVQGLGIGFITMPIYIVAFATLAPRLRTDAAGLLNLSRLMGSSIMISVVTTLLARSVQTSHSDMGSHINASASAILDTATTGQFREFGEGALRMVDAEINRQAAMIGYVNDYWLIMWITIAAAPLILLVRRAGAPKPTAKATPERKSKRR